MGKEHQNQKKAAQPKGETNALATRKINAINREQTPPIQSVHLFSNSFISDYVLCVMNIRCRDPFHFKHTLSIPCTEKVVKKKKAVKALLVL
jgi:hypothetical protein